MDTDSGSALRARSRFRGALVRCSYCYIRCRPSTLALGRLMGTSRAPLSLALAALVALILPFWIVSYSAA